MKKFESAEIEIIALDLNDAITCSILDINREDNEVNIDKFKYDD